MILKNIFKGGWGTDRPYKCPQLYIGRSAPVPKFGKVLGALLHFDAVRLPNFPAPPPPPSPPPSSFTATPAPVLLLLVRAPPLSSYLSVFCPHAPPAPRPRNPSSGAPPPREPLGTPPPSTFTATSSSSSGAPS